MDVPPVGDQGKLPCRCCRRDTVHEVIPPVAPARVFVCCTVCGTVSHAPKGGD